MRSINRAGAALAAGLLLVAISAAPALACGGLIGPNGAVNLLRTTTFAGYHAGEEHYVTAFEFAGGGGAFGSLTPLPGIPSSVVKGGDWTLQRLRRETNPEEQPLFLRAAAADAAGSAEELMKVKIDALDITVLRGGAAQIGQWATDHGFRLPPDAPEVLDFYTQRSPIFLAAAFDADAAAARGQAVGDGTPVHITIPTDNPWVPLRILALGKTGNETVDADVYLMTDHEPAMLPAPTGHNGMTLDVSEPASTSLLDDLRSDKGMDWVPSSAWLLEDRPVRSGDRSSRTTSRSTRPVPAHRPVSRPGSRCPVRSTASSPGRRPFGGPSACRSCWSASAASRSSSGGARRGRRHDAGLSRLDDRPASTRRPSRRDHLATADRGASP